MHTELWDINLYNCRSYNKNPDIINQCKHLQNILVDCYFMTHNSVLKLLLCLCKTMNIADYIWTDSYYT